jgi:hypothetical protein
MADVFKAYQILNKSLNLNLSDEQMLRCEAMAKQALAKDYGFSLDEKDADNFGLFVHFVPRRGLKINATRSEEKY